jgi:AraC-like DNA-binding protein
VFERSLLDMPLEGGFPALHKQAEYRVEQRLTKLPRQRQGLMASITEAFARKPRLLGQGIESMAQELGVGARTLQRRLREEGQSYAALQADARYQSAMKLLQDPLVDVEAVSEKLGFSDRRSFTRAFTRWSGVSPSLFRKRSIKS